MSKYRIILLSALLLGLLLTGAACKKEQQIVPDEPGVSSSDTKVESTTDNPVVSATDIPDKPAMALEPDMKWDVVTDYSGLTSYVPVNAMHTRLSDGALSELIPSNDYGMLLPYAGAVIVPEYGSLQTTKYGLVTASGVVVTDAIYDSVLRAYYDKPYFDYVSEPAPAYRLALNVPDSGNEWYIEQQYAACAIDGSWVTAFDYVRISFNTNVITLWRDDMLDIDVYDYNGKLLYKMQDKDWTKDVDQSVMYGYLPASGDNNYTNVKMKDGTVAFIDLLTGTCRRTEFTGAGEFNEGLAPAAVVDETTGQTLWGYINNDFEIVIQPEYSWVTTFHNGHATVTATNNACSLIDKQGNTLLSVKNGYIDPGYYTSDIAVYDYDKGTSKYYTNDLIEISTSTKFGECDYIYYVGDGWYAGDCYNEVRYNYNGSTYTNGYVGKVLLSAGREYLFHDILYFSQVARGYVVYTDTEDSTGVMTLHGWSIIPPEKDVNITVIVNGGSESAFLINKNVYYYDRTDNSALQFFRLIGTDGTEIASGFGILSYDDATGLYSVITENSYSYLDNIGSVIISIPLMSYMMD